MPPQRDETDASEDHAVPSTPQKAPERVDSSYWEAPDTEESLKGKTLSTLSLSALESNHPEEQQQKKDDYWEAPVDKSLEGKTLSTLDMTKASTESPKSITAEEPEESTPSYWDDAPIDNALKGKRLSALDVSALATNHPDQQVEKQQDYWGETPKEDEALKGKTLSTLDMSALESNHPDDHQKKKDDYWGEAPKEDETLKGKTLSTLSMSALESNHPDEKKEQSNNYWEAPEEEKLKGKRLSVIDMKTLEHAESSSTGTPITATEENTAASYWDEAPICDSLKGKRLSAVDLEAMSKQKADDKKKKEASSPYWEWQGVKAIKKTLSKLSMSNLRKGSAHDVVLDDDDCVHGGTHGKESGSMTSTNSSNSIASNNSSSSSVKPITQKKHKLRDSWRRSFQRLSTNTLDQLDESSSSGPRMMGKRIFKKNPLDWSTGSRSSQTSIGEDAIMF